MKKIAMTCVAAAAFSSGIAWANDDDDRWDRREAVQEFATLPAGVRYPEGIAANPRTATSTSRRSTSGRQQADALRATATSTRSRTSAASRCSGSGSPGGRRTSELRNSAPRSCSASRPTSTAQPPWRTSRRCRDRSRPAPRAVGNPDGSTDTITFGSSNFRAERDGLRRRSGNLYISDSFQGAIYKVANATTCAAPCAVTVVKHDPLLATAGFPPFGANGLALSGDGTRALHRQHRRQPRAEARPRHDTLVGRFAESVHGADGLLFENGRLWVAANQDDELVALNAQGRPVARLGGFEGVGRDGRANGLLFPASMAIVDDWMYVTNLALPLTTTRRRRARGGRHALDGVADQDSVAIEIPSASNNAARGRRCCSCVPDRYSGTCSVRRLIVMRSPAGGFALICGTFAPVMSGAAAQVGSAQRGTARTTGLGGSFLPFFRWSYIQVKRSDEVDVQRHEPGVVTREAAGTRRSAGRW